MALEFVIIPATQSYEDYAYDVQAMMQHNIKRLIRIQLDTDYNNSLYTRIHNWNKDDCTIITVDENYFQNNTIIVRFQDNDSDPEQMGLLDFIDTVTSFENEDDDDTKENEDNSYCAIM